MKKKICIYSSKLMLLDDIRHHLDKKMGMLSGYIIIIGKNDTISNII